MDHSIPRILTSIPKMIWRSLSHRFDRSPFATVDSLAGFVETRAAYVAQTALYGYLKTRMGTRFVSMFQDEVFSKSIDFAKWRVYAACLADLSVFAAALVRSRGDLSDEATGRLARHCFIEAVSNSFAEANDPQLVQEITKKFDDRLSGIAWQTAASGENAFSQSPGDLIKWAPIADELKQFDEEIVSNSIRFRWRDVREQLRKRIDAAEVSDDWSSRNERDG